MAPPPGTHCTRRAGPQNGSSPGDDVERRDGLGQECRIAVRDARYERAEANTRRLARQRAEHRVGLEHLRVLRAYAADLEEVVHHRHEGKPGVLGGLCLLRDSVEDRLGWCVRKCVGGEVETERWLCVPLAA